MWIANHFFNSLLSNWGIMFYLVKVKRHKLYLKQVCIPVGRVPAARRPYAGVYFPGGGSSPSGGGVLHPGGFSIQGGFSIRGGSPSRGSPSRGVLHPGGGFSIRGVLHPGGYGIPACTEADTLPPCGQTDTCQNITLATTSLRPVISPCFVWM